MLQSLFYFILISGLCIIWGLPFYLYYGYNRKTIVITLENIIFSFFLGLGVLAIFTSWVSLFLPLKFSIAATPTLLLVVLEITWLKKMRWRLNISFFKQLKKSETLFLFAVLLLFSFLSTGKPALEDTDLYHVQSVKWIHEYGTVPGLANLYLRYGFYSNWFHLISFFYLPFENQNFLYLNYTSAIWMFFFLFYQYKKHSGGEEATSKHLAFFYFFICLFMLIEWDLFRVASSSTSYDFIITSITLIAIHFLLKRIVHNNLCIEEKNAALILIITAPFFKITGFLIVPFILLFLFYAQNKIQLVIKVMFIGIVCFIPYAYKSYLQTGYIFFPYQFADFFHPAWKVPSEMTAKFNHYIYLGNHYINQAVPKNAWTDNEAFSYYRDWFLHLVKADQILILASLISLPVSFLALKKVYGQKVSDVLILYFTCIVPLPVWLVASPDLRFVFGLLIFIVFFPITVLLIKYIKQWVYAGLMGALVLGIGVYIYKKRSSNFDAMNLLYVKAIDVPPYSTIHINNQVYFIPEIINNNWNSRCLNCPIPCIYQRNPYLQLSGKELKSGFKMSPYPDSVFIQNYRY